MKDIKDVIVIGAGPVGSYSAYQLAKSGFDVTLLEEHAVPGEPTSCTGVIGAAAFDDFDIPKDGIINKVKEIKFISPFGREYIYKPEKTQAAVVDRRIFDYKLMKQAQYAGAQCLCDCRAADIKIEKSHVEIEAKTRQEKMSLKARVVIIATGFNYRLNKKLGLGLPPRFLNGAQVEAKIKDIEMTEVYFGSNVAPGSFAWAVPLSQRQARIGLTTDKDAAFYLRRMLKNKYFIDRVQDGGAKIVVDNIAMGIIPKSFAQRVLVVGEAAGQVKATTNGGVVYGLNCSRIAVDVIKKAFKKNNFTEKFFSEYEKLWHKKYGFELKIGYYFRGMVRKLSNEQLERLFELSQRPDVINILKKKSNFDRHKDLVLFLLKNKMYRDMIWQEFWETVDFRK